MNDENLPPEQDDMNLSIDSVKAGAAVFGSLVFGSEYPEHSLCYSPSPILNRRNQQNNKIEQFTDTTKSLDFDATSSLSIEEKKDKTPDQADEKVENQLDIATIKRQGSRRGELLRSNKPRMRKKPAGLKPSNFANVAGQRSIDLSSKDGSVNPIINEARRSKEESIKEKILTAVEIREQRRIEREESVALNAEAEKTRREVLELRKQLNERFARAKIDRENRARQEHLAKVENEIQFKSKVHVEHKQTLNEIEDARRRMSMNARAKLRQNHRDGKERMRLAAIAEDQALFEERHESSIAIQNTKKNNAERSRRSFAFRNGDARRIRELFAKMEEERLMREHESYELKWAGERDADAYKQQMAKERRDSLAFRIAEGHRIRDLEATMKSDDWAREHESYEVKWAGERDADAYKQQMAKERRDSLAFRNAEGHRIRDVEATMKSDDWAREHESYELKWAGERDADAYKQQMAKERRDSLAFRNAEGHRIRDVEATMKSDDWAREHESYELKWAGERDADAYKQQMAKERRDSLAFRNAEGHRIRDVEATMKSDDWAREHESYELKWAGERDVDAYKQQMAKERRDSLAFRNAEGHRIRDLEATMKSDDWAREHESYEVKWAGERDVDAHKQQMAKERRDSLAFRNAEGHRIRDVEATMKSDDWAREHESYELKWAGERDVDAYKQQMAKERRDSLAFRNAEGHRIRDLEATMKSDDWAREHESYELKWAGERDVDAYKQQMAKERRDSLAFRNAEGHRIRDLEATMKSDDWAREHESYELKWAGERDADAYKQQMAKERRDSLAFRNQEAAKHDAVMKELQSLARDREHESYMLKWAGENDAKQYLADQEELRRQSLAFRNAQGKQHREFDEAKRVNEILENTRNEELAAACQKDVEKYKAECAAKERADCCLRGKENFANRVHEENKRQAKLEQDHQNHLLDTAAWQDVNDYVEECKRRSRLSLAFRAKEKRRHFEYAKKQAALERERLHRDTRYKSEDAHYVEIAKLREKARIAIDSFKYSPVCSFGSNPFATLLE